MRLCLSEPFFFKNRSHLYNLYHSKSLTLFLFLSLFLSLSFALSSSSLQAWDSKGYVRAQILHLYFLFLSHMHSLPLARSLSPSSLSLPISLGNFRTNSAALAHLILKDTVRRLVLQEPLYLMYGHYVFISTSSSSFLFSLWQCSQL